MTNEHAGPGARDAIDQLARRRAQARAERDFESADRLKAQIERAGWKVIDDGPRYRLEPAFAANVVVGGVVRYGSSAGVPERLHEPDSAPISVVALLPPPPGGAPAQQWIAVVEEPPAELALDYEALATQGNLGLAAAWNAGLRRAVGSLIVLLGPGLRIPDDAVASIAAALADESVAVCGSPGLTSRDLRRWQPAPPGDVDALDAGVLCFRRRDLLQRGPLDERFATPRLLAVWWSLLLRDEGPDRPPRRALALDIPLESSPAAATPAGADEEVADRQTRRDLYRLLDRFGRRFDLLGEPVRPTAASVRARRLSR